MNKKEMLYVGFPKSQVVHLLTDEPDAVQTTSVRYIRYSTACHNASTAVPDDLADGYTVHAHIPPDRRLCKSCERTLNTG